MIVVIIPVVSDKSLTVLLLEGVIVQDATLILIVFIIPVVPDKRLTVLMEAVTVMNRTCPVMQGLLPSQFDAVCAKMAWCW